MVILAARPSMGKTSFALNIAQNIANAPDRTVLLVSPEMSTPQIVDRLVCATTGLDSWKLHRGGFQEQDFMNISKAVSELSTSKIYINDASSPTLLEIGSAARRLAQEGKLDLLVIDYIQLLESSKPNETRTNQVSEISR